MAEVQIKKPEPFGFAKCFWLDQATIRQRLCMNAYYHLKEYDKPAKFRDSKPYLCYKQHMVCIGCLGVVALVVVASLYKPSPPEQCSNEEEAADECTGKGLSKGAVIGIIVGVTCCLLVCKHFSLKSMHINSVSQAQSGVNPDKQCNTQQLLGALGGSQNNSSNSFLGGMAAGAILGSEIVRA